MGEDEERREWPKSDGMWYLMAVLVECPQTQTEQTSGIEMAGGDLRSALTPLPVMRLYSEGIQGRRVTLCNKE